MQPTTSIMKSVFMFTVRNKPKIINCFRVLYGLVIILWFLCFYLSFNEKYTIALYNNALLLGKTAVILFCITITAGILKRFSITWNIRPTIMLIRRQLGVLTFSVAFLHFSIMRLFPYIHGDYILRFPLANFELFGLISLLFMSFLFFTSNEYSVRKLGKWWNRIHMLIYGIAWTIAFHVALIAMDIYTYIIITFALLETISLIYFYILRKKPSVPPPVNPKV